MRYLKIKLCLVLGLVVSGAFAWFHVKPTAPINTQEPTSHFSLETGNQPGRSGQDSVEHGSRSSGSGQSNGQIKSTSRATTIPLAIKRPKVAVLDGKEYPVRVYEPLLTPNDPQASQWWTSNARLNEAWDVPESSNPTLLAVIDTGFALEHEEFTNRWYTNADESGSATSENPSALNCSDRSLPLNANCNLIDDDGDTIVDNETGSVTYQNPSRLNCSDQGKALTKDCNQVDDDGNGFTDDANGWDFINYDNSTQAGELNPSGEGTMHGTAVAGVAAATGNNSKGIAGANWNTKILPLQVFDDDSYGDSLSVARAILYAASQGADVISLSLGSYLSDDYVRDAVQTAIASGSVVVAASGNDGCDCISYPANYPEVVAVGASNSSNQPAYFSSWGANLDILAPGTQITAPTWQQGNPTSAYDSDLAGTSFAAPLVSGVLTRLAAHQPNATPLQLIAALTENTNRLSMSSSTPHDTSLGFGKLDSFKAVTRMTTAINSNYLYAFEPVSKGDYSLFSQSEIVNAQRPQECENSAVGTTPLFEAKKTNSTFFTISRVELAKAQADGYDKNLLAYICLQQPQDSPSVVRLINLFREFRNVDNKVYQ